MCVASQPNSSQSLAAYISKIRITQQSSEVFEMAWCSGLRLKSQILHSGLYGLAFWSSQCGTP